MVNLRCFGLLQYNLYMHTYISIKERGEHREMKNKGQEERWKHQALSIFYVTKFKLFYKIFIHNKFNFS